jgi:hypothetical protein
MLSRQPSQQWRDEARRAQRDRAARGSQVGWSPQSNMHRGDPRDGPHAGPVLQRPNMPGFNTAGPAHRRSNGPIVCCGIVMERDSQQFRIVKILVGIDVLLITICLLVLHDSAEDGLTLGGYALVMALTMCFAPLLIVIPFVVAAVCKCWYDRKIEAAMANSLIANNDQEAEAARLEAARLERIRAEMASTVMSGLRGETSRDAEQPALDELDEEPSGYSGHMIVEGEVLGDIILLDEASAAKLVSAMPVTPIRSASAELAATRPSSAVEQLMDLELGLSRSSSQAAGESPRHLSPRVGSRESSIGMVGPAIIATGRVVQPGDWRLGAPR